MSFDLAEARAGLRDIAPAAIAAIPISLLYGALASAKGLSPLEITLMSAFVFAGGAQFAAVELWTLPPHIAVLVFSTALINARHILMGISIAPKLRRLKPWQRWLGVYAMADENWAMTERRALTHPVTATYFLAMSGSFWLNWVLWSALGGVAGSFLGDPKVIGADFAFTALFIGLIAGFWRGRATGVTVAASGVAAALAHAAFGSPWHVAAGAVAGIVAAFAMGEPDPPAVREAQGGGALQDGRPLEGVQ